MLAIGYRRSRRQEADALGVLRERRVQGKAVRTGAA
jgi:hypothetical protein